jgi:hypothetical protein
MTLQQGMEPQLTLNRGLGGPLDLVCMFWRREQFLSHAGNWIPNSSVVHCASWSVLASELHCISQSLLHWCDLWVALVDITLSSCCNTSSYIMKQWSVFNRRNQPQASVLLHK